MKYARALSIAALVASPSPRRLHHRLRRRTRAGNRGSLRGRHRDHQRGESQVRQRPHCGHHLDQRGNAQWDGAAQGFAKSSAEKSQAESIARGVKGVKSVRNDIIVRP